MTTMKRARVTARLVAAIEKNEQTIAALAEAHGFHPAQLSALLRGAPAGASKQARLVKLAKSLGLKPEQALAATFTTTSAWKKGGAK